MTDLLTRPDIEKKPQAGGGVFSHIVKPEGNRTASAIVTEARVTGTPVEALCGYVWVPSLNPKNYPTCPKCLEIYRFDPFAEDGAERQNELPPEA